MQEPANAAGEAVPAQRFEGPGSEQEFESARALLLHPPAAKGKLLFLIATLLLFVFARGQGLDSLIDLALVVAVLFFHELGHYVGMRHFGYRDVRIFFIPFFGAAVSGQRRGVAPWQEAVVLLMGPLPGILLGIPLYLAFPAGWLGALGKYLLIINGLNLAPIPPLDGGQLFRITLFARQRHLELAFNAVAAAGLVAWAVAAGSIVLGVIGGLGLISLGRQARIAARAHDFRQHSSPASSDPALLDEAAARALYARAATMLPSSLRYDLRPRALAIAMEEILYRAATRPPAATATAALLSIWLSAVVLFLGALVMAPVVRALLGSS